MKIIQLQRLNPTTLDNEGGLYINIDHISALIPHMSGLDETNQKIYRCEILLNNGVVYLTPFSCVEIFDKIYETEKTTGTPR